MSAIGVSEKLPAAPPPVAHAARPGFWHHVQALLAELRGFSVWVRRTAHGMTITADVPRVRKDEVNIELTEFALIIEIEQRGDGPVHKAGRRLIALPSNLEIEEARAQLSRGVLTVRLTTSHRSHSGHVPVEGLE